VELVETCRSVLWLRDTFLTQEYEAGMAELSTLWLSDVKWMLFIVRLDRQRDGNLYWTGGGSAHLACEAVLEVSGEVWARREAVVQVSTQRKATQASHYIDLSENGSSRRAAREGVLSFAADQRGNCSNDGRPH